MLGWALVFLVIALVAALFGFGVVASASAGIAKFCSLFSWFFCCGDGGARFARQNALTGEPDLGLAFQAAQSLSH